MGIEHLLGKRTGRPRGTKSTPAGLRDARWVNRNLGREGVIPPTPLAERLLALAREAPDRFAVCLATMEADHRNRGSIGLPVSGTDTAEGACPLRVKSVFVSWETLRPTILGPRGLFPGDARLLRCVPETRSGMVGVLFIVGSQAYSPVPSDKPIPELKF